MKTSRNMRFLYPTSLLLLASLGVGNLMCGCHGIAESWWRVTAGEEIGTCPYHEEHADHDAHPADESQNCECKNACCWMFLPQPSFQELEFQQTNQEWAGSVASFLGRGNSWNPSTLLLAHQDLCPLLEFQTCSIYIQFNSLLI